MSCSDVNMSCPCLNDGRLFYYFCLTFFVPYSTPYSSVNLETKLRQEVRRFCFNVLRAFALKMRKLPRLSDVGCFPNHRSAFLRFLMASLHSSLNHGFPGCFGFVEVFGIVSSAIDITVS